MDYADPANRRLRDEPVLPLSPEETAIADKLRQEQALLDLIGMLTLTGDTNFPRNEHNR